jgi:hypothetical protein
MKNKIKPLDWNDVLKRMSAVRNFRALIKWYNVCDNFALLLHATSEQNKEFKKWLFSHPLHYNLKDTLDNYRLMGGALDFMINDITCLRYRSSKQPQKYLTFHPFGGNSLEEQTFPMQEGIINTTEELMRLQIPFMGPKPFSEYRP